MKLILILTMLFVSLLFSCNLRNRRKVEPLKRAESTNVISSINSRKAQEVDDKTKFRMFCTALDNNSTEPNYIVITVKNVITGEKKEICAEAPFLDGAYHRQYGKYITPKDYDFFKDRYFEFTNDSALWNISFDLYTSQELKDYKKNINIEEYIEFVKRGEQSITFDPKEDRKKQIMFAHIMFNAGIMMTRGCAAGNICRLSYFK